MQGLLRCARYSFAPNKLRYCGPDKNKELEAYLKVRVEDRGLKQLLNDFGVMYPYLKLIADENGINDPFDERVVEAYWIGNELLETVSMKEFYDHLMEGQGLKKRFKPKDWKRIVGKVPEGAKVHHSFHVFNIWSRTGHEARLQTVETMDSCRISAGEVVDFGNVKTNKLIYQQGQLSFEPAIKEVQSLENGYKPGDLVTIHWNWVCEKINQKQAENLEKYTKWHLKLANLTI